MSVCTETYEGIDGIYGLSLWWGRGGWCLEVRRGIALGEKGE